MTVTRQDAIGLGRTTYSAGRPCRHGHICERYVADTKCVMCIALKSKSQWNKRRQTHKDRDLERYRLYREQNREKILASNRSRYSSPQKLASDKKWREANRQREIERNRAYRIANAEAIKIRERAAREANREVRRMRDNENRRLNRDRYNATKREWSRNNRDKVALKARRRRARRRRAEGFHTIEDLTRIRLLQGDRCAYCRIDLAGIGCVDHIVALANGGSNWPRNLQFVCHSCNSRKRVDDPIDFARKTGRLL